MTRDYKYRFFHSAKRRFRRVYKLAGDKALELPIQEFACPAKVQLASNLGHTCQNLSLSCLPIRL